MENKEIFRLCMSDLSKNSVGRDNLYKFFLPDVVDIIIKGATGIDPTDEQMKEVSNMFKESEDLI